MMFAADSTAVGELPSLFCYNVVTASATATLVAADSTSFLLQGATIVYTVALTTDSTTASSVTFNTNLDPQPTWSCPSSTALTGGGSVTCTFNYTVTESDTVQGTVTGFTVEAFGDNNVAITGASAVADVTSLPDVLSPSLALQFSTSAASCKAPAAPADHSKCGRMERSVSFFHTTAGYTGCMYTPDWPPYFAIFPCLLPCCAHRVTRCCTQ